MADKLDSEKENIMKWANDYFAKNGRKCPFCGCRRFHLRPSGRDIRPTNEESRIVITVVCDNPECGYMSQFAPRIGPA